jgi:Family of unknown function (DUF6504)
MAHRYGLPVRVETDDCGAPTSFVWRGQTWRGEVIGSWHLMDRWWVCRSRPRLAAFGREERGPSNRWYYRVQTPDFQVFELYRDSAAGDVWVLDVVHD